jgi:hypothetical protein
MLLNQAPLLRSSVSTFNRDIHRLMLRIRLFHTYPAQMPARSHPLPEARFRRAFERSDALAPFG